MVTELKKHRSVHDALKYVSEHSTPSTEDQIQMPVYEAVARKLFSIANSPDPRVRGSEARATRAQKIILDRLVGRRAPGTAPAQGESDEIEFLDLTAMPVLEEKDGDDGQDGSESTV